MFIVIIIELMEEDERKLRFLIEMLAVVLIGIIRLLCSPCQVAFMDNDENVIVAIADLMLLQGKLNDYMIHVMIDVIFNIELNESEYKYGFHDYNDNSQKQ